MGSPVALVAANGIKGYALTRTNSPDLGVASGHPTSESIVLWTHVPAHASLEQKLWKVDVNYEVSITPDFSDLVRTGTVTTGIDRDYTVKAFVDGLEPFTKYYYRFFTDTGYHSVIGETKTAPSTEEQAENIRFATISCQDFTVGYYTVYESLLKENLDFVVHLGDSIYEKGNAFYQRGQVRFDTIGEGEAKTLSEYRQKYHLYLSDPYYRELRRLKPFINLSDDHEVFNDWGGHVLSPSEVTRKRAGLKAFHEYTPTPFDSESEARFAQVYRKITYGPLIDMFVTDQRQFRVDPCNFWANPWCDASKETMLGADQLEWLKKGLLRSQGHWRFMLSQLVFMPLGLVLPGALGRGALGVFSNPQIAERPQSRIFGNIYFNKDGWDGYQAERKDLTNFIYNYNIDNFVVLSGDVHNFYAGEVMLDPEKAIGASVGVELVSGSITSNGIADLIGFDPSSVLDPAIVGANPHLKFANTKNHGYCYLTVSRDKIVGRLTAVATVKQQSSQSFPVFQFTVPSGENRLV
jgi:alkaline phosphatase D